MLARKIDEGSKVTRGRELSNCSRVKLTHQRSPQIVVILVACRTKGPGFNPRTFKMFCLSLGIGWLGKLRTCESKIAWCQRTWH